MADKVIYIQGECANCKSNNITYEKPIISEQLIYPYKCNDCKTNGKELYDIVFFHNEAKIK